MGMRIAEWLTNGRIGGCLLLVLIAPTVKAATMPWQDSASVQQDESEPLDRVQKTGADGQKKAEANPAEPGTTLPDAPEVAQSTSPTSNGSSVSSQPNQEQQQNTAPQPVGTAAAPEVKGTGVSGSRVSGAAIAPAKQRRVRIFVIKVAVVAAACIAVGTVVALTHATPSQPR